MLSTTTTTTVMMNMVVPVRKSEAKAWREQARHWARYDQAGGKQRMMKEKQTQGPA